MTTCASFRLLRTGLISSTILGLAAGGHLAGGGTLPEPVILMALCALTVLPVSVLTTFRLSMPVLAGLLGAGQLWLHWAFHALSGAAPAAGPALSGHAHHTPFPAMGSFSAAPPADTTAGDWQMFAAHAVATLATAVVLARGEQTLWALAAWLRPLAQLPVSCTIVPARVPGPCMAPLVLPRDQLVRRMPARRGPPASLPAD
ncbi:hypothetical protein J2X01_003070 [Arthrobacter ginsengisoli]|uniref:MFS transporter n=1 Tax=Arthrobacter ginsengisoli TaxID=1356565 RepID=A0ABU1UF75_9MICC|nr:hypothetical protein [Arthrobacter ginsengisoli]MDR7083770.1 hypothetical protein [Arthrobacter ginsengisoli]